MIIDAGAADSVSSRDQDVRPAGLPPGVPLRPSLTALIVDDEPDQLGLLTAYFHREGCTVIGLSDGEKALALPADLQLDLMVLDLRLPGLDGWQLAGLLGSRFPGCPIAITSVLDVEDYPRADRALPKPVTRAAVQRLLATLHEPRSSP